MKFEHDNATYALLGRTLKNNWKVTKKIEPSEYSTGGNFSVCYIVSDGNKIGFLKALDIKKFVTSPGQDIMEAMNVVSTAFIYERNLLKICSQKKFTRVALILDEGIEKVDGYFIPNVPYMIFELADGDVRNYLSTSRRVDNAWKLRSLHNVSVGLMQLHSAEVTHQDLKPSNILLYETNLVSKIGDLGRAICKNIDSPYDKMTFAGDGFYAPMEITYGYHESEWNKRVYLTDAYMLGSLACFYFTGSNINGLMFTYLDDEFKPWNWGGTFYEVLPYIMPAFYTVLDEIMISIDDKRVASEVRTVVEQLCHPDPQLRCNLYCNGTINSLILEKVVSALNKLARKLEINIAE